MMQHRLVYMDVVHAKLTYSQLVLKAPQAQDSAGIYF